MAVLRRNGVGEASAKRGGGGRAALARRCSEEYRKTWRELVRALARAASKDPPPTPPVRLMQGYLREVRDASNSFKGTHDAGGRGEGLPPAHCLHRCRLAAWRRPRPSVGNFRS